MILGEGVGEVCLVAPTVRQLRGGNSCAPVGLGAFSGVERLEFERLRFAGLLARDQCILQRLHARFVLFEQPKARPHDVARRALAAGQDLDGDETGEVVAGDMDVFLGMGAS